MRIRQDRQKDTSRCQCDLITVLFFYGRSSKTPGLCLTHLCIFQYCSQWESTHWSTLKTRFDMLPRSPLGCQVAAWSTEVFLGAWHHPIIYKSQRLLQAHCEAKSILPWAQLGPTPSAVELKLRGTYDVVDGMLVVGWVDVVAMPPSKGCSIFFSIIDSLPSWEFFLIMLS